MAGRRKTKKELYGGIAERLYVDSGLDLPEIQSQYLPHVSLKSLEMWRAEGRWIQKAKQKATSAGEIASGLQEMIAELSKDKTVANADAIHKLNKSLQGYITASEAHFPERAVEVFERFSAWLKEREPHPGKRQEIFGYAREFLRSLS